jgi:hypothetical protein
MLSPPAKRRRSAASQARWRARVRNGELMAPVIVTAQHREKLTALGYLDPARESDRHALAAAIAKALDLIET